MSRSTGATTGNGLPEDNYVLSAPASLGLCPDTAIVINGTLQVLTTTTINGAVRIAVSSAVSIAVLSAASPAI